MTGAQPEYFTGTQKEVARTALARAGVSEALIDAGALDATFDIAFHSGLDMTDAAEIAARAIFHLRENDKKETAGPTPDLERERTRARGMAETFFARSPRVQVMALPPRRTDVLEVNPFVLVFDRVDRESVLGQELLGPAREALQLGLGASAVMVFSDEVEVVPGFEVSEELAGQIRAALEGGER